MVVKCLQCGSSDLHASKRGVDFGRSAGGAMLFGPVGLLEGAKDANKILITCLACGFQFRPGDTKESVNAANMKLAKRRKLNKIIIVSFAILMLIILLISLT